MLGFQFLSITSIYRVAETGQDSITPLIIVGLLVTVSLGQPPLDLSTLLLSYCSLLFSLPNNCQLGLLHVLAAVMIKMIMKPSGYLRMYQHPHSFFSASLKLRKKKTLFLLSFIL